MCGEVCVGAIFFVILHYLGLGIYSHLSAAFTNGGAFLAIYRTSC